MTNTMGDISNKIKKLKASVPEGVEIVLVTKTVPPERIREALVAGAQDLGENRVQELLQKQEALLPETQPYGIRWHMIGHLQTNKVKQILGRVALIHSLDRLELAGEIERQAQLKGIKSVPCLIQVNSSGEETKFGLRPEDVEAFVGNLNGPAIQINGLMTIGPLTGDKEKIRRAFRSVRELQADLRKKFPGKNWDTLSMGMSGDYPIAIEEGATMIRIGTAVFGERHET